MLRRSRLCCAARLVLRCGQEKSVSFTYSFLAARCELPELQAAMLAAWPTLEVAEPVQTFASWDEALQWSNAL
jgi:hypothetical protein